MNYFIAFLEGIITFISPCLLPMLPIYVSFFAGQNGDHKRKTTIINSIGFVLGFTIMFVILGAFAGAIGGILKEYHTIVNLVSGIIVILFGLNFMEVIRIPYLSSNHQIRLDTGKTGFLSSLLFGIIFSVGWTPCVGAFLGSALMLAASSKESITGIMMLLCFSIGLGIPFIISAVILDRLKSTFQFIKNHYRIINLISGILLVIVGFLMATELMGYYLSLLTF